MSSLWNPESRLEITRRVAELTNATKPRWGKMNAEQMLAHLINSMRMSTGELPVKPKRTPLRFAPVRWLAIHKLPFPKGAPTAPELQAPPMGTLDESRNEFQRLLDAFGARDQSAAFPDHPVFGKMTPEDWGVLGYRHFDHHLRQFGL
jgi:hypothetical protein